MWLKVLSYAVHIESWLHSLAGSCRKPPACFSLILIDPLLSLGGQLLPDSPCLSIPFSGNLPSLIHYPMQPWHMFRENNPQKPVHLCICRLLWISVVQPLFGQGLLGVGTDSIYGDSQVGICYLLLVHDLPLSTMLPPPSLDFGVPLCH